jgi:hypothetical protein
VDLHCSHQISASVMLSQRVGTRRNVSSSDTEEDNGALDHLPRERQACPQTELLLQDLLTLPLQSVTSLSCGRVPLLVGFHPWPCYIS